MYRPFTLTASLLAFATFAAATPAQASLFCEVLKTRDNFVALRAAPNAGAKITTRMKAGGEVRLLGIRQNGWEKVTYWPNNDRIMPGGSGVTFDGWVNAKLISDCG